MECGGFFKARWRWCGIGTLTNSFVCYLMMKKGEEKKNLNTHTHTQSIGSLSTKGKKKKRKKKTARGRFVKRLEPTHGPHFFFFFFSFLPVFLLFSLFVVNSQYNYSIEPFGFVFSLGCVSVRDC